MTKEQYFPAKKFYFQESAKRFYREVGKETIFVNETPTLQDVKKFWKEI